MKKFNTSHKTVRIVFKYLRGFCSKSENQVKTARKEKAGFGFPICSSFTVNYKIHKAVAGLLTYSVGFNAFPSVLGWTVAFG